MKVFEGNWKWETSRKATNTYAEPRACVGWDGTMTETLYRVLKRDDCAITKAFYGDIFSPPPQKP